MSPRSRSKRVLINGQYRDHRALYAQLGLEKESSEWHRIRDDIIAKIILRAELSPNSPSPSQQGNLIADVNDYILQKYARYFLEENREEDLKFLTRYITNRVCSLRYSRVNKLKVLRSQVINKEQGTPQTTFDDDRSSTVFRSDEPEAQNFEPRDKTRPKLELQDSHLKIINSDPVYQFLNKSRPPLTHLYEGFKRVGCHSMGHLEAMADWPVDAIQMFFEKMKEVGTPLTMMDGLVLRLALKRKVQSKVETERRSRSDVGDR